MYPIIFEYKFLKISSYGLMLMLAFLICNYLLRRYLVKINQDEKIADDIIFYAALGGILGSKLYYIFEQALYYSDYSSIEGLMLIFQGFYKFDVSIIFSGINQFGSGLVFLGGLIGGFISVTYYIKKNSLNTLEVYDWVAPFLALGHAIGRVGCFLVGDCYGKPCSLPWAVTFKEGLPPTTFESFRYNYPSVFNQDYFSAIYNPGDHIYVHPTQLYEFSLYFLIFLYLQKIKSNKSYSGIVMFEYLFLAGMIRFLIEFIRLNPPYLFNLSGAQIISLFMILISSFLMYFYRKKTSNGIH